MRAAVQTRYGPPEVVRISEVEKPTAKDNEVLVKVYATTVNRTDCACRAAKPFFMRFFTGLTRPRATILGNEFAGEVQAIGRHVTSFKVGDRVFGYNEGPFGAIGSAAVQLLKRLGANVTAVCDTDNLELVRGLGADRVIDYTTEDFTNDEQRYDEVLDSVGKSSFSQCKRLLKPDGIYLSSELGPRAQNPFLALIAPILGRDRAEDWQCRHQPRASALDGM